MANKKTSKNAAARLARGSAPNRGKHGRQHRVDKHPRRGRGRPPGALNHLTRQVKEAILNACSAHGFDGQGEGGLEGFLYKLCAEEPRTMVPLIRAVLPTEITVERKAAEPRTLKDVREGLASVGLKLEDLRPFKFHTPEQVLELTGEDVTDDGENKTS